MNEGSEEKHEKMGAGVSVRTWSVMFLIALVMHLTGWRLSCCSAARQTGRRSRTHADTLAESRIQA
jgi:hypothetical protein